MKPQTLLILAVVLILSGVLILIVPRETPPLGSAQPGIQVSIASSSNPVLVATTVGTVIGTTTCAARIITTQATAIVLTFNDRDTPTLGTGVWQGASTTVAYDSGQYGCGKVKAISSAAQVLSVIDAR